MAKSIGKREATAHLRTLAFAGEALDPGCEHCKAAFARGLAYPHKDLDR